MTDRISFKSAGAVRTRDEDTAEAALDHVLGGQWNNEDATRVLEFVAQARDGMITAGEMVAKIEQRLATKFETEVA